MEPYDETPAMLPDEEVEAAIIRLMDLLSAHKPNDRSEKDRKWAIIRTDVEKIYGFWLYMESQ